MLKWLARLTLAKKVYDWYTGRKDRKANKPRGLDRW